MRSHANPNPPTGHGLQEWWESAGLFLLVPSLVCSISCFVSDSGVVGGVGGRQELVGVECVGGRVEIVWLVGECWTSERSL